MASLRPEGAELLAPIAIVGMSCRLPGSVSTLEDFWTLLSRARSGWCEVPSDRFSKDAYHHPSPQKKGCFNAAGGYFMDRDLSKFDAPFFNITEQEATGMDPQQRQLLECTYEALENAGIPKETIAGRNMGVFVGGAASDYRIGTLRDLDTVPMFDATGNHQSILSGRISHFFDLRGPSFTVDTACSSGLYALHQAVQSIRAGESEQAVVAGCHLHFQPDDWVSMSMLGIFNDHGKTYTFDHRAKSGFARGEGVGCLILKSLDQAVKDGDKVRSIIVNTGINQDGKTLGLSTPNGAAQEQLMKDVYAKAGISPEDAGFIEAHGTGTKVGDPIEARAIYNVFGAGRSKRQPLNVGSVKTNVGHLENASGIISVIKATLMLEKNFILPNLNFEKANESIPLDEWNMKVPTTLKPWPQKKRFLSINNFGFGGANAHCVLERPAFSPNDLQMGAQNTSPRLFILSGHDETSAKALMRQLGVYVEQHPEVFQKRLIKDIAYTLCQRRSQMPWRVAIPASSCNDLVVALNSPEAKPSRASKPPKIAFVYTGQGAQWHAMGRELMASHPVFNATVCAADDCLQRLGADFSLTEELKKDKESSQVGKAHISQPACTAVQLALTALLASWGIQPRAVTGHSSGEIAAAYATGAISLDDAMAVAYHRGQATLRMKERHPTLKGSMLAVGASPADVRTMIKTMGMPGVAVACENSPGSTTASGDESSIDELAAELEKRSLFNRKLRVEVAYHSSHMELVADDYFQAIRNVKPMSESNVAFFSSLKGHKLNDESELGAQYWTDNLTRPVLFSSALNALCMEARPDVLVEVGPHAALEGPIKQILKGVGQQATGVKYIPTLVRNEDATMTTIKLAGSLWMKGQPVDFASVNQINENANKPQVITDFAPYPWTEHKYWYESRLSKQHRIKPFPRHDLLGLLTDGCSDLEPSWRNVLTTDDLPWLKDHRMQSLTTFPLAGYMTIITEAAAQRASLRGVSFDTFCMREVQVSRPLIMDDGTDYETMVVLRPYAEGTRSYSDEWDEFRLSSWTSARGWLEHCRGLVATRKKDSANPVTVSKKEATTNRLKEATDKCQSLICLDDFYSELGSKGATYGPLFQLQKSAGFRVGDGYSISKVEVLDTAATMPLNHETESIMPTSFMDLFFQLTFAILGAGKSEMSSLYMPSAIKELEFDRVIPNKTGNEVLVVAQGHVDRSAPGPTDFHIDAWESAESSQPLVKLSGFRMTPVKDDNISSIEVRNLCYKLQWEPLEKPSGTNTDVNGSNGHANGNNEENGHGNNGNGTHTTNGHDNGTNGAEVNGHGANGVNCDASNLTGEVSDNLSGTPIVVITEKDATDPFVRSLVDLIDLRTGSAPTIRSFDTVQPASDKAYICLCEIDSSFISTISPEAYDKLQRLLLNCSSLLWVSTGAYRFPAHPERNLAQGLLRTVRSEMSKAVATLDLDPKSSLDMPARSELILKAIKASVAETSDNSFAECEFAEENGQLVVQRVLDDQDMNQLIHRETQASTPYSQPFSQAGRRLKITVGTAGALDSLYFRDEAEEPLADDEIEIKLAATGMNFKDVVIAMGQIASPYLGVECSGTVARIGSKVSSLAIGDRVCAMSLGAYSTFARCKATSAAIIPGDMSIEAGASIPVVYSTAYYGIMELARLEPGEKILIHAASGGVGQAAIQLAQMIGAEIYATVGSVEKKQHIMEKYNIPASRIFYSRSTAFGPAIREATGGEGVDVVINSLAGDLLRETWDCVAHFGRFIEIGKRDITSNTRLEMAKFEHNATFSSVDLTVLAAERPKIMGRVLTSVMKLLEQGKICPIDPITIMGISEVESALRLLQSGKTSGKVIIAPRDGEKVKATHRPASDLLLKRDATYVIIGGTGGLGRSMTKWMARNGAGHVMLLSRSGRMTDALSHLIEECRTLGTEVHNRACDVASEAEVIALVEECGHSLPPIRGVVHAAMVLRDMLFEKTEYADYETVVRSKVSGAQNFHNATLGTPLDFFVMISSVAGIVGNRGQAAYAAANTYLDALARHRVQNNLAGAAIDLAAVEGVGYLAEESAERQAQVLQNLSGNTLVEGEVLALLDAAIRGHITAGEASQCLTGLNLGDGSALPFYAGDAKFAYLRAAALASSLEASAGAGSSVLSISQEVQRSSSPEDALSVVTAALAAKLCTILMLPPEEVDENCSVTSYGLDSLNAIELRNWMSKELQAHLQVLELLTSGTLKNLAALILKKTRIPHNHAE